jgi:radical SAM superfamily enzyme YgiQ (UPF0313 family)
MLTLINANTMVPPIGPIGADYITSATAAAGIETDFIDLCLSDDPAKVLRNYFSSHEPALIGISFRNVDDCFWPSAKTFVPDLVDTVKTIREMSDAPIVIGGVGFSIFAERIIECTCADFGIRGDGEQAIVYLYKELHGSKRFESVPGLVWRGDGELHSNSPAWPEPFSLSTSRDNVDNLTYFKKGGQCGFETKRGCNRKCIYCADLLAKGPALRIRKPSEVADEVQALLTQGINVLHTCDSEFNIPRDHAYAVCEEFNLRGFGRSLQWYAYMAVVPFDAELADIMKRAGCVGINFTGDSANTKMLKTYHQQHKKEDLASAVRLCRDNGIKVMTDLMLGGPGETPQTVAETIEFIKRIGPDCAGASLGIRIYPCTEMAKVVTSEGSLEDNPNILRKYNGPVDFFRPTFYIDHKLGPEPARLVRDLVGGDKRFFEPMLERSSQTGQSDVSKDHNYNDNTELVEAIKNGARGAYWDILHQLRSG